MRIQIKRVYDEPSPDDGHRVLIDRLWPRGVRKDDLRHDAWAKGVAPSSELRKEFHQDPDRFEEFVERYRLELADHGREIDELLAGVDGNTLTLLYASRDPVHNHAVVLRDFLVNLRRSR
ncbi:MAG: DUF488 family protein [Planctomycetes bacterium]|nr:DUF488 family protein [Planctomycetota bacterium]